MEKKAAVGWSIAFLVIIISIFLLRNFFEGLEYICAETNCYEIRTEESKYCSYHEKLKGKYEKASDEVSDEKNEYEEEENDTYGYEEDTYTYDSNTYDVNTSTSTNKSNSNYTNSYTYKNDSSSDYLDSYDSGYEDIYMDGDYDWDRYYNDDEYALGVDDAMEDCAEEFGDEW